MKSKVKGSGLSLRSCASTVFPCICLFACRTGKRWLISRIDMHTEWLDKAELHGTMLCNWQGSGLTAGPSSVVTSTPLLLAVLYP